MTRHLIRHTSPLAGLIVVSALISGGCGDSAAPTDIVGDPAAAPSFSEPAEDVPASVEPIATGDVHDGTIAAAPAEPPTPAAKPKREPIYEESDNGETLIAASLERARRDNKHVLIEWGGNWCGWCYKLHDVFTQDEDVRPIVHEEFELVLIDSRSNDELMKEYGGTDGNYSYPHLTILDAEGNVLVNQNTEPLEDGRQHDPAVVATFLKEWTPAPLDAEEELKSALEEATENDQRILVHVGNPYCGWCKVLSNFLHEHETLFSQDYIDLKIDTLRMSRGKEVAEHLHPEEANGVPWMVILDASGEVLADSVGPQGNIGYPVQPHEVDHFLSMLQQTSQRMTETDFTTIRSSLETYREERERRRQREREETAGL